MRQDLVGEGEGAPAATMPELAKPMSRLAAGDGRMALGLIGLTVRLALVHVDARCDPAELIDL
jgi:hypothetical protein